MPVRETRFIGYFQAYNLSLVVWFIMCELCTYFTLNHRIDHEAVLARLSSTEVVHWNALPLIT